MNSTRRFSIYVKSPNRVSATVPKTRFGRLSSVETHTVSELRPDSEATIEPLQLQASGFFNGYECRAGGTVKGTTNKIC